MSFLVLPVSMLVLEFVGSVCEASSSMFFSEGVPSGIHSSGCKRGLSELLAKMLSKVVSWLPKGLEKIVLERKKESMGSAWWFVDYSWIAWQGHWFVKGNRSVAASKEKEGEKK